MAVSSAPGSLSGSLTSPGETEEGGLAIVSLLSAAGGSGTGYFLTDHDCGGAGELSDFDSTSFDCDNVVPEGSPYTATATLNDSAGTTPVTIGGSVTIVANLAGTLSTETVTEGDTATFTIETATGGSGSGYTLTSHNCQGGGDVVNTSSTSFGCANAVLAGEPFTPTAVMDDTGIATPAGILGLMNVDAAAGGGLDAGAIVCDATGEYAMGDCGAAGCQYIQDGVDFTVEFWVKPLTAGFDTSRYGFGAEDSTPTAAMGMSYAWGWIGADQFRLNGASGGWNTSKSNYDADFADNETWTHFAVTWDEAAGDCEVFANGTSIKTNASCGFDIGTSEDPDRFTLCDVLSASGTGTANAASYITDIRVWDTPRDPVSTWDCQLQCADGVTACPSGLQNYWPANDGSGTIVTEVAGGTGAVDLDLTGATWTVDAPAFDGNDGVGDCAAAGPVQLANTLACNDTVEDGTSSCVSTPSGGTGSSRVFSAFGCGGGGTLDNENSSTGTFDCINAVVGTNWNATVTLDDDGADPSAVSFDLYDVIAPAALANTLTCPDPGVAASEITCTSSPSGGTPPYVFSAAGAGGGGTAGNLNTATGSFDITSLIEGGPYTATITVDDDVAAQSVDTADYSVIAAGATWQPAIVNREKACQDLIDDADPNTTCGCSETLNVGDDIQALGSKRWNPSNSLTGAGETQCDQDVHDGSFTVEMGPAWLGEAQTIRTQGSEVPFSTGADPFVYLGALSGQHRMWVHSTDFTDQTACLRDYRRYSPGTRMNGLPTGDQRIKIMTLSRDTAGIHANFANNEGTSNPNPAWHVNVIDGGVTPSNWIQNSGLETAMVECSDNAWCRMQVCADHNVSASTLKYRFYLDSVDGAFSWSTFSDHTNAPATVSFGVARAGPQFFVQGTLDCRPDCHQYTSHVMTAVVPYNTSYTIPAACELETPGGCDP